MLRCLRLVCAAMLAAALLTPAAAHAATYSRTVTYGPYSVPGGSMDMPGMKTSLQLGVRKPCGDCYLTYFKADLVDASGKSVNMDDGAMLHHVVFASQWRSDATCSSSWLGLAGQRFFASGNERTTVDMPDGYGYRERWWDSWNMLVELMNMQAGARDLYVNVTFHYRSISDSVKAVTPLWLDINECGDSEYSIPAGYSDTTWHWTANMSGSVVDMIGHVHAYGEYVKSTDNTRGRTICKSDAMLDPMTHEVMSMSACKGTPSLATICKSDDIQLDSVYDSPVARNDVMGIMLGYVYPTTSGCTT
jgi:hypothetical protein